MSALLWALPGLPIALGAVLALAGRRADVVARAAGVGGILATAAVAGWAVLARPAVEVRWLGALRAGLAVDGLSAVMVVTVLVVALAVVVFATADPEIAEAPARFFGLLLLFVGAMLGTVTATSLGALLGFWEVMGACSWALIGFAWREDGPPRAANQAFLVTRAGDLGLYLACAAAVAGAGTLQIAALAELPEPWLAAVAAGLIAAAVGKSAQLPLSTWLRAAMQGPSPVSALLHSATMVAAGAYLLLRTAPVLEAAGWAAPLVAWLGAVTALVLGLVAVAQRDLKQLLAASTCAQMGFLLLAAGAAGVPAGTAHLVAHAAFKSLLFLSAGALLAVYGTRDLARLRGAARGRPVFGTALALGGLSLAAVPPLSGWVTKDEVLAAALERSLALYLVALAAGAVSALYAGKMLVILLGPRDEGLARAERPLTTPLWLPSAILAVAVVGLAVLGLPAVRQTFEELVGGPTTPAPHLWELALSAALAVAALAAAAVLARSRRLALDTHPDGLVGWLRDWLHLDQLGAVVVVRPVVALAAALAALDDHVVDAGVRGVGGVARWVSGVASREDRLLDRLIEALATSTSGLADISRGADERGVDGAVEGLAGGLGAAGRLARRPQTGSRYDYYAQALVVLVVLAAVFTLLGALT